MFLTAILGASSMLSLFPPSDFAVKAEVACVLPFVGPDQVLLLQRVSSHPQANLWTAPGGKIKKGETALSAVLRELEEETGIVAHPDSLIDLGKYYVRYPNGDFIFYLFKTSFPSHGLEIKIREKEHQDYWIGPIEEAGQLSLTPGLEECFDLATGKSSPKSK